MAFYVFNGKTYPRVTEILRLVEDTEGLQGWRNRTPDHEAISTRAKTLGSLMHWCLANELSPVPIELDKELPMCDWPKDAMAELSGRMNQFKCLRLAIAPNPVLEHVIHHDEPGEFFAGTLDGRGDVNGYKAIWDYKGSKRMRPEYRLQLGAYYIGSLREGFEAERGFVIRLQRDEREVLELDDEELRDEGAKFLELSRRWHKE